MARTKVKKRAAISPRVQNTVKTVHEVTDIIKRNDIFCKRTKTNNIANNQIKRGVRVLTDKSKIQELKDRIRGYKSELLTATSHSPVASKLFLK